MEVSDTQLTASEAGEHSKDIFQQLTLARSNSCLTTFMGGISLPSGMCAASKIFGILGFFVWLTL